MDDEIVQGAELVRNIHTIFEHGQQELTQDTLERFLNTMPRSEDAMDDEQWEDSYFYKTLKEATADLPGVRLPDWHAEPMVFSSSDFGACRRLNNPNCLHTLESMD